MKITTLVPLICCAAILAALSPSALAAPTLANIDADPNLEVVVNTVNAGSVAYDLPGSAEARVLWQTGRNKGCKERAAVSVPPLIFPLLGTP